MASERATCFFLDLMDQINLMTSQEFDQSRDLMKMMGNGVTTADLIKIRGNKRESRAFHLDHRHSAAITKRSIARSAGPTCLVIFEDRILRERHPQSDRLDIWIETPGSMLQPSSFYADQVY